ncbi:MAG: phosphoglucomutase/phosphomannomutase family protein, partial [Armatimonadota bacterium]
SIKGHIPEKDGVLAVSLMAEVRAFEKKTFKQILKGIMKKTGTVYNKRIDLHIPEDKKKKILKELSENTPKEIAGIKVKSVNKIDGIKMVLEDGSWLLMRPSGTEPIVRVYIEASSVAKFNVLSGAAERLLR